MSRPSTNFSSTEVCPWVLAESMREMPGRLPRARSSGVATVAAIDSGEAPGRLALTSMAG